MKLLIGLGGNVGAVPAAFSDALGAMGTAVVVEAVSPLYRSRPLGPPQPEYWNMAALVAVEMPLLWVLERCQQLELRAGRHRQGEERWGPRPLDLDLLLAPGLVHRGPRLTLPHPRFHRRAFAVVPAADLAPEWVHPYLGRNLRELAGELRSADPGAVRLATPPGSW
ncbi:MAG: 2-amino-4-hydroxy-6-hydroxymethyldihydropteridine diphosphokinase [Acidobacteria bacterium]|nr:2-amino-4-hydroxy-6-hydroxymethyldihydropteridine diphosphokinase [Acidobacteriota bacterium]